MCNLKEISPFNRINLTSVEMGVVDRFKLLKQAWRTFKFKNLISNLIFFHFQTFRVQLPLHGLILFMLVKEKPDEADLLPR